MHRQKLFWPSIGYSCYIHKISCVIAFFPFLFTGVDEARGSCSHKAREGVAVGVS